jgi:ankyrin repeat protein
VNAKNKLEVMPLHWAAQEVRLDIVKVLLANGAKVAINARSSFDFQTALYNASGREELDIVNGLIESSVAVNVNNKYNETPLHEASRNWYLAVVQVFLKMDADVNARYYDS